MTIDRIACLSDLIVKSIAQADYDHVRTYRDGVSHIPRSTKTVGIIGTELARTGRREFWESGCPVPSGSQRSVRLPAEILGKVVPQPTQRRTWAAHAVRRK